jgi:hypothetical protein
MVLINRNNGREFPKAYQRIGNDGTPESPKQAIVRLFNQQVQVANRMNGEVYDRVDIGEHDVLGPYNCFGYFLPVEQGNAQITNRIFTCRIDMEILALRPRDQNNFQVIVTHFK